MYLLLGESTNSPKSVKSTDTPQSPNGASTKQMRAKRRRPPRLRRAAYCSAAPPFSAVGTAQPMDVHRRQFRRAARRMLKAQPSPLDARLEQERLSACKTLQHSLSSWLPANQKVFV